MNIKYFLKYLLHKRFQTPDGIMRLSQIQSGRFPAWFHVSHKDNELILRRLNCSGHGYHSTQIKPIMRRISSLTETEKARINKIFSKQTKQPDVALNANLMHHLIGIDIWVFGDEWFDQGLVIDSDGLIK